MRNVLGESMPRHDRLSAGQVLPSAIAAAWVALPSHLVLIGTASFCTVLKAPQSRVLPAPAQLTVPPEEEMVCPSRT